MEFQKEREMVEQIQHRFHEHPLVLVEEQSNQSEKTYCSGCGDVVSGSSFSCVDCKYHLHKKCAEAPLTIKNHRFHRKHPYFFFREGPRTNPRYVCALCKEKPNIFHYECWSCMFFLDIKCALSLLNLGGNFDESKHDAHQHPLTFIESHKDEFKRFDCSWCHEPLVDYVCICFDCQFYLHKKCLDLGLPTKINHLSHRIHPLILELNNNNRFCKLCQKEL